MPLGLHGQELNVDVVVDRSRLSSSSLNYMDRFDDDIEEYLNDYRWTEDQFQQKERIDATMQITLLNADNNYNFEASVVIRSERPVYNSLQKTPLFYFNDENWVFNYTPNRGLVHDLLQFDPITTFLDYYAHIIIGYDYDSFSELAGTPFYSEAQNLVSLAQALSSTGWSRTGGVRRNRAQLVADLLNGNYEPLRRAIYIYHRQGLDRFLSSPEQARLEIIRALRMMREAQQNTTGNLLFDIFFNAKYRELVSLFGDAPTEMRLQAFNILSRLDPAHLSEYRKLQ